MRYHYYPKFVLDIRVHSWWVHSVRLDKCARAYSYHWSILQNIFTAIKTFVLYLFIPSFPPVSGNLWHYYCRSSAVSRMSCSWNYIVCSLFRLDLLLSNIHLRLLHVFHDLIACFFQALNNIPLSGCTRVYPFMYLVVPSYKRSYCKHLCADFCVHTSFQLL